MVLSLESTGARMSRLGISVLNGLPILSVDEVIERIDAVDVAALRELAGELFVAERLSVACVGPEEEAFREALDAAGGSARHDREWRSPARPGGWARRSARRWRAPRTWSSSGAPTRCSERRSRMS